MSRQKKPRSRKIIFNYLLCSVFTLAIVLSTLFLPDILGDKWDMKYMNKAYSLDRKPIDIAYGYTLSLPEKMQIWQNASFLPIKVTSIAKEMEDDSFWSNFKQQLQFLADNRMIPNISEDFTEKKLSVAKLYSIQDSQFDYKNFRVWELSFDKEGSYDYGMFLVDAQSYKIYYLKAFNDNTMKWWAELRKSGYGLELDDDRIETIISYFEADTWTAVNMSENYYYMDLQYNSYPTSVSISYTGVLENDNNYGEYPENYADYGIQLGSDFMYYSIAESGKNYDSTVQNRESY